MKIEHEILSQIISKRDISIVIHDWNDDNIASAINKTSLGALEQIQRIIKDDSIDDCEAIEKIIDVFNVIGLDSGSRHDW